MQKIFKLRSKVWRYPGMAGWFFLSVPKVAAKKIKKTQEGRPRVGWGSIRVEATIGKTVWRSSIFPDTKSGTYLLPLKAAIRKREGISEDQMVTYTLHLLP